MAYTQSGNKAGNISSTFGNLVKDRSQQPIPFGTSFVTQDATGTPVTSPATVNTTQTLVVPLNAYEFIVTPVTNPVQVSEDSTQSAFYAVPAGATQTFPCARQNNIYLKTGGSTVVSFAFRCV